MRDHRVGSVVIVDPAGSPVAMVTDRDLALRVFAEGVDAGTPVGEHASRPLISGEPEMELDEAAALMVQHRVRRLPVVDGDRLAGIVTLDDIAVRTGNLEVAQRMTAGGHRGRAAPVLLPRAGLEEGSACDRARPRRSSASDAGRSRRRSRRWPRSGLCWPRSSSPPRASAPAAATRAAAERRPAPHRPDRLQHPPGDRGRAARRTALLPVPRRAGAQHDDARPARRGGRRGAAVPLGARRPQRGLDPARRDGLRHQRPAEASRPSCPAEQRPGRQGRQATRSPTRRCGRSPPGSASPASSASWSRWSTPACTRCGSAC